ncbi:MAG TPA: hypothetical protein PLP41_04695 [Treponemataceae bacterium]|nr:hypothetical protein [Treponemataceae bacterium]HOS35264.1 hypothetical protein [Treponemataceae bacterium]HPL91058.1 hypothetical protein [Treponemataceae bacterium]
MKTRKSGKYRKTLTVRFLYRTVLSLTFFSIGLAVFFFFGSIQQFLDSTQVLIVTVMSFSSLTTVLAAIPLIVPELVLAITNRHQKFFQILVVSILCILITSILAVLSRTILLLSAGLS